MQQVALGKVAGGLVPRRRGSPGGQGITPLTAG